MLSYLLVRSVCRRTLSWFKNMESASARGIVGDRVDPRGPWTALWRHAVVVSFNPHILEYRERTMTELEEETPPNIVD